jgi:hypothetical protein
MAFPEIDEDELYRQIAALYANDAGPDYDDAPITYEDAPAIDEPQRPATAAPDELTRAEETMADVLAGAEFAGLDPKPS